MKKSAFVIATLLIASLPASVFAQFTPTPGRNAILFIYENGRVQEVFRNPVDSVTKLRNLGPLETPTSPVLAGNKFCTANSDGNRRDNFPSTAGEIGGTTSGAPKGKISCINQRINVQGLPLPIK